VEDALSWEHQRATYVSVYDRLLGTYTGDPEPSTAVTADV
jgi:hypothetical protein